MGDDVGEILEGIGPRLRRLRRSRRLTLAEVAADAELSVSLLSRLETGRRQPTLDALIPLARAFGVAIDALIGAPATGDPRAHLTPRAHGGSGVIVPLTERPGRVRVFKHVLGPREVRLRSHDGSAWLYVLSGDLRLLLGERELLLAAGESAEFDAATPHWFGPASEPAVELLHFFGPSGDRLPAPGTATEQAVSRR